MPHSADLNPAQARRITALVLLGCLAAFTWQALRYDTVQDDAYITLVYAKHLAAGEGLVFNPGERVEGYTNFLWTLVLAVPHLLDIDALTAARALSALCAGLLFALLAHMAQRQQPVTPWPYALVPPILLASCGAMAFWTTSGMETALFALLITAGACGYARELSGEQSRSTAWLFALAGLTRPEGFFFFGLTLVHRSICHLHESRFDLRDALRWGAPALLTFAAHSAFRLLYYGHLLPNTLYAKTGARDVLLHYGWQYTQGFLKSYGIYGLLLAVPLLLLIHPKQRDWRSYRALLITSCVLYTTLIGGDVLDAHRFYLPILPLIYLSAQDALHVMARTLPARLTPALPLATLTAVALYSALAPRDGLEYAQLSMQAHNARLFELADCINSSPHATPLIATGAIGITKYLTQARVIDLIGLTDSTIARHPARVAGLQSPSILRQQNAPYVLDRQPDMICFITGLKPQTLAEKTLFLHERFRRDYYTSFCSDRVPVFVRKPDAPTDTRDAVYPDPPFVEHYIAGLNAKGLAAIPHHQRAIETGPADFEEPHLRIGIAHYANQEHQAARPFLERAASIDPYTSWAYAYLALLELLNEQDLERALHLSHIAASLTPRSYFANYVRGSLLGGSDEPQAGKAFLQQALALGGDKDAQCHYKLALIAYYAEGDIAEARRRCKQAIAVQPDYPDARQLLATLEANEQAPASVPRQ